jgi:hypothetical protein
MSGENKNPDQDADFIMEEFEWALEDPTAERLKEMGEVVTIITSKLVSAIDSLQNEINGIKSSISSLESQISSLSSRVASGATVSASPADAAPAMAKAPTPGPSPAPAPSGPTSMMGELKSLLAARRKKAETGD